MTPKTKRKPKAPGLPAKPKRISLGGGYQFARIEGRFSKCFVAMAYLYPHKLKDPVRLYASEARKLAAFLIAFADWADAQAARLNTKSKGGR